MGWQRPGLRQQVVKKVLEAYFSHHLPCVTTFPPFQPQTTTSHTPLPWFFQHFHPSSSSSSSSPPPPALPPHCPQPSNSPNTLLKHTGTSGKFFFSFALEELEKITKVPSRNLMSLPPVPSEVCLPPLPPLSPFPTSSFHPFIPLPGSPSQFPSRVKFPLVRNDTSAHSVTSFPPICTSKSHLPAHF